jgi:hypothetical protein
MSLGHDLYWLPGVLGPLEKLRPSKWPDWVRALVECGYILLSGYVLVRILIAFLG